MNYKNECFDHELEPDTDLLWEQAMERAEEYSYADLVIIAERRCPRILAESMLKIQAAVAESIYEEWKYSDADEPSND